MYNQLTFFVVHSQDTSTADLKYRGGVGARGSRERGGGAGSRGGSWSVGRCGPHGSRSRDDFSELHRNFKRSRTDVDVVRDVPCPTRSLPRPSPARILTRLPSKLSKIALHSHKTTVLPSSQPQHPPSIVPPSIHSNNITHPSACIPARTPPHTSLPACSTPPPLTSSLHLQTAQAFCALRCAHLQKESLQLQ
ncbi:hypothetical protein ARMSODRAFT_956311 [Armillaria solidipes]|uniref:Uncharacterized protein n=1 Tax=Armillaria solidipes TaxID=1076256 RepID=A0A2H3BH80_9AGAR|nr:hypothetical protein ARMSODRAFT_956311 [Armillaria solidipes]